MVGFLGGMMKLLGAVRIYRRPRNVRVCETLVLGDRKQLLLVEWDGRQYLIGVSQQGFAILDKTGADGIGTFTGGKG